jgi:hypothetical protein
MFWCDECECSYPHGPEGPGKALSAHVAERHGGGSPDEGITGRQVLIAFAALVVLSWLSRGCGFGQ